MTDNTNPGNFANRPKEEVVEAAKKGGKTVGEGQGFAGMDTEQVVSNHAVTSQRMIDMANYANYILLCRRTSHPKVAKHRAEVLRKEARQPKRQAEKEGWPEALRSQFYSLSTTV